MTITNLDRLKTAYRTWADSKGASSEVWLDLMSDDVRMRSMGGSSPQIAFAEERRSKQEAVAYFAGLARDWSMVHWTPEVFVSEGDRIAVFSTCAWTHKSTGKTAEVAISHLWQFKNGKAVEVRELFDSARAIAAATP